MSRFFNTVLSLCALGTLAAGCSSMPLPSEGADKIAVYEAEPPDRRPYRLVKRIWVTTWRSVAMVPTYRSVEEGTADLRNQAVVLGGDAIMNFGCYRFDASIALESRPKMICNGNVIKFL
jgi:hypothetical protein